LLSFVFYFFFFFNDTATTEIYTLSLHDALPIPGLDGGKEPRRGSLKIPVPAVEELAAHENQSSARTRPVSVFLLDLDVAAGLPAWIADLVAQVDAPGPDLSVRDPEPLRIALVAPPHRRDHAVTNAPERQSQGRASPPRRRARPDHEEFGAAGRRGPRIHLGHAVFLPRSKERRPPVDPAVDAHRVAHSFR